VGTSQSWFAKHQAKHDIATRLYWQQDTPANMNTEDRRAVKLP